ncbi:hypothetical protein ACWC5I_16355 [Kitasatospora sp. NPDC001574]
MTEHHIIASDATPQRPLVDERRLPPCDCHQCRGGPPVSDPVVIAPRFTNGDPNRTAYKPLATPYDAPRGALVHDVLTGRLGVVMDRVGRTVHLRPEAGGCEWETSSRFIDRPPAPTTATSHRPIVDPAEQPCAEDARPLPERPAPDPVRRARRTRRSARPAGGHCRTCVKSFPHC